MVDVSPTMQQYFLSHSFFVPFSGFVDDTPFGVIAITYIALFFLDSFLSHCSRVVFIVVTTLVKLFVFEPFLFLGGALFQLSQLLQCRLLNPDRVRLLIGGIA